MENHLDNVLTIDFDVLLLQEVDVEESFAYLIKQRCAQSNVHIYFSKRVFISKKSNRRYGRRVAIIVRSDLFPFTPDVDETNEHITTLTESCRWVEVAVPLGKGDAHLLVAPFYCISGASSEPAAKVENARPAAAAFVRKAHSKDVPISW